MISLIISDFLEIDPIALIEKINLIGKKQQFDQVF